MAYKIKIIALSLIAKLFFLATTVKAAAPQAGEPGQSIWIQMLPLLLIFAVFFILVIWPQQRKMKKHRETISKLAKGDNVITSSGLFGSVHSFHDDQQSLYLTVAEKMTIRISKDSIAQVLSSGENSQKKSSKNGKNSGKADKN